MTTRLAGTATHFLPFNKGCDGGAGNPPDPAGRTYRTAYLWEEVLQRDSLLDILARFIHLQIDEKRDDQGRKVKVESMIFPRYHQLDAVRRLVDAARSEGVGHNYLVEHSAGSGKSNTIGWLAHRLASLHDAGERARLRQRDRRDRPRGARPAAPGHDLPVRAQARRRAEDRRALAAARRGARERRADHHHDAAEVPVRLAPVAQDGRGARRDGTGTLPTRRCAVIIDEAHSSQGGETATDLKEVLGGEDLREEARQARRRGRPRGPGGALPQHGQARPAGEPQLLRLHGHAEAQDARRVRARAASRSHRYTMRQAIEEGFILDVLKHYTTLHDLLQAAQGLRGRPERRAQEGGAGARALHAACTRTTSRRRPR